MLNLYICTDPVSRGNLGGATEVNKQQSFQVVAWIDIFVTIPHPESVVSGSISIISLRAQTR